MGMPRERFTEEVEERTVVVTPGRPVVGWGGVFSGLVVGAGAVLLLSVFGVALGVSVLPDPGLARGDGATRLGIVAAMWAGLSLLVGFFLGGMVAARATNQPDRAGAVIQGMLVWMLGIVTVVGLVTSGLSTGVTGLFQGLGLLTRGAIVSGFATATGTSTDEAGRALDDLRARIAPIRDDPARVAAEVQAFFEQYPERPKAPEPAAAATAQRTARLGSWITLGALLLSLLVAVGGALTGTPDADHYV